MHRRNGRMQNQPKKAAMWEIWFARDVVGVYRRTVINERRVVWDRVLDSISNPYMAWRAIDKIEHAIERNRNVKEVRWGRRWFAKRVG